jgi:hypothetical protein
MLTTRPPKPLSVEGYYDTHWLTGLWSTQAKVEDVVLKAAWHRGSISSVVNNPLVEPGRTPFDLGLPSAWDSVDGDRSWALETECLSLSRGTLLGEPGGRSQLYWKI